jgi:Autographiviridae endonuclease VII
MDSRICRRCKEEKPRSEFRGRNFQCIECLRDKQTIYRQENRKELRKKAKNSRESYAAADSLYENKIKLMHRYGLTVSEFNEILSKQGNVCAICGSNNWGTNGNNRPVIDHCHDSNVIRGFLCVTCNAMLGSAKNSPKILRLAADYLE